MLPLTEVSYYYNPESVKKSVTAFAAVIDSTIFKAKCLNKLIVSASQCLIINLKIFKRISNHINDATSMLFWKQANSPLCNLH